MRLLTLASMAQEASELEFDQLVKRLDLKPEEVEPFIIEGIGSGLIQGKINEPERKVTITSNINRTFKQEQWQEIKDRLELWQKNIVQIQDTIKSGNHFTLPVGGG